MAGNSFGNLFKLTTFGESHGKVIGGVIDGCPSRVNLDLEAIQKAKESMENISWAIKGVNIMGNTLESGSKYIPEKGERGIIQGMQDQPERFFIQHISHPVYLQYPGQVEKKPDEEHGHDHPVNKGDILQETPSR